MNILNRAFERLLKLPPPETRDIVITPDIKITMPDGVALLADHYAPRTGPKRPTILIRSPYGRRGLWRTLYALPFVQRGYQVFIQSCRGTGGSGGEFVYARREHSDGLATIEWIKKQEWFSGELATVGASYLGFVQWAVAAFAGPELKTMVPSITASDFNHFRFPGGAHSLESMLDWSTMMAANPVLDLKPGVIYQNAKRTRRLPAAYRHLPLIEADRVVIGRETSIYRNTFIYKPEDDHWKPVDYSGTLPDINIPINLQGGWYDLFLPFQLKDYLNLRALGKQPYLLIGPWYHGQPASFGPLSRDTLDWLKAQVKGDRSALREKPVRLFVMGADEWRDFADWPPPATNERWYLHSGGWLGKEMPSESKPVRYRYDPANPTPTVGGSSLGVYMGRKDNRKIEERPDVLVYTSPVLEQDLEVIGPVTADLYVRSSLEYTDFFARLCVVKPSGKSLNLCDGILRLTPGRVQPEADGSLHIQVELWPTAYRFKRGERIRMQVSSGAYPRYDRNLGSGEDVGMGTTMKVAEQEVFHDPVHPSAIILPVLCKD